MRIITDGLKGGPYLDGEFVVAYDPNRPGKDRLGRPLVANIVTTRIRGLAKRFESTAAAMECWRRVADPPHHLRPDGKPNRPLTAFTVAIEDP